MLGRARDVVRAYRAAYRNWPLVLLGLAFRGRARAVTRDGRVVEGDSYLIGTAARLYALGLRGKALDRFLQLRYLLDKGGSISETKARELLAILDKLYELRYELRCCKLVLVSDDLSYVILDVKGRKVTLWGWDKVQFRLDINDYMFLNVKNKSVLDIGAYVGDSSILFAAMGAKRVVAVEPSPWAYNVAKKNVEVNRLGNVVTLVNCAVGREDGKVLMLPSGEIDTSFRATDSYRGDVPVPTCTLDSLIERYGPFDVVKVDCEGCEHDSIPYSRRIGEVREVLVEYHDGYEDIVRKLREEGFKHVKYSKMLSGGKLYNVPIDMTIGLLYAYR